MTRRAVELGPGPGAASSSLCSVAATVLIGSTSLWLAIDVAAALSHI